MSGLVEFLNARLDADEQAARRAGDSFRQIGETGVIVATEGDRAEECASAKWAGVAEHIVRHDPARVRADLDAKRRVVGEYERAREALARLGNGDGSPSARQARAEAVGRYNAMLLMVRIEAGKYASHPEYQETWKP